MTLEEFKNWAKAEYYDAVVEYRQSKDDRENMAYWDGQAAAFKQVLTKLDELEKASDPGRI